MLVYGANRRLGLSKSGFCMAEIKVDAQFLLWVDRLLCGWFGWFVLNFSFVSGPRHLEGWIFRSILLVCGFLHLLKAGIIGCFISTRNTAVLNLKSWLRNNRLWLRFQIDLREVTRFKRLKRLSLLNGMIRLIRLQARNDRRHLADLFVKLTKQSLIPLTRRHWVFNYWILDNCANNDLLTHGRWLFFNREHLKLLRMLLHAPWWSAIVMRLRTWWPAAERGLRCLHDDWVQDFLRKQARVLRLFWLSQWHDCACI